MRLKIGPFILKWVTYFIALFVLVSPSLAAGSETVILQVILNEEAKGNFFLTLTEEKDILFLSFEKLEELGFTELPEYAVFYEDGSISLKSLSPGITFELSELESTLRITSSPKYLKKNVVSFSKKSVTGVSPQLTVFSGFLNYDVSYFMGDEFDFNHLGVPFEIGAGTGGIFLDSNFSYIRTDYDEGTIRLMSNITKDDTARSVRYVVGDFSATSGEFGSTEVLGGISVSKNFSIKPYFVKYPELSLSGVLNTPSEIEIYVDGTFISREQFSPGEFSFTDIPSHTGAGELVIIIKDAYGRKERIVVPYYRSSSLLKAGLHEYSYNLGFKREEFGTMSNEYGELAFIGFHRFGFTDRLTAGMRGEAKKNNDSYKYTEPDRGNVLNFGPTATISLNRFGELSLAHAKSVEYGKGCTAGHKEGFGNFFEYSYDVDEFSAYLSLKTFSREYSDLEIKADDMKERYRIDSGISYDNRSFGLISASFSSRYDYDRINIKNASLSYSRRLYRNLSSRITFIRTEKLDEIENEVMLSLSMNFDIGDHDCSLNYNNSDGLSSARASVMRFPSSQAGGLGYNLSATTAQDSVDRDDWSADTQGVLDYHGSKGLYSASYYNSGGVESSSLKMAGSIAYMAGSFYMAKPIYDSFALVDAGGLEGVTVLVSNQESAITGSDGKAFIENLKSYYDNSISLKFKDIPLDYSIAEKVKSVSTPYRGGVFVEFDIQRYQAFEGKIFYTENGVRKPAQFAALNFSVKNKKYEIMVGIEGFFFIENIPAGTYPVKLKISDKECDFFIVFPESNDIIVNMGEISCEFD